MDRDGRHLGADRRHPVFLLIVLHSKHLHIGCGAGERLHLAPPQRPRPAAPHLLQGRAGQLRGPARRRHLRQGPHRRLHVEELRRLHGVHRVRPLPVAVPGLEHRQAAEPQAHDHEPARHDVHAGPVPDGRQGRAPRPRRAARGGARRRQRGGPRRGRASVHRLPRGQRARGRRRLHRSTATAPPASSCRSSTRRPSGRAPPAAPASTSAPSTSSTSTTSSTCAATRS